MNRVERLIEHVAASLEQLASDLRFGRVRLTKYDCKADLVDRPINKDQKWVEKDSTGRVTHTIEVLHVERHRAYLNEALARLGDEPT